MVHNKPTPKIPRAAGLTDLRGFLDLLRQEGELVEINAPVDPDLEAAEIHRRVIAAGGPALLFTNVRGAAWPCVTNLFGTARRVNLAFGPKPEVLVARAAALPQVMVPPTPKAVWAQRDLLMALRKVGRKSRSKVPVTACVDRPAKLSRLPLLRTWEQDGGPFVTLPLVQTEHPRRLGAQPWDVSRTAV